MAYLDKINVKGTEYDIQDSKAARQTEVDELKSHLTISDATIKKVYSNGIYDRMTILPHKTIVFSSGVCSLSDDANSKIVLFPVDTYFTEYKSVIVRWSNAQYISNMYRVMFFDESLTSLNNGTYMTSLSANNVASWIDGNYPTLKYVAIPFDYDVIPDFYEISLVQEDLGIKTGLTLDTPNYGVNLSDKFWRNNTYIQPNDTGNYLVTTHLIPLSVGETIFYNLRTGGYFGTYGNIITYDDSMNQLQAIKIASLPDEDRYTATNTNCRYCLLIWSKPENDVDLDDLYIFKEEMAGLTLRSKTLDNALLKTVIAPQWYDRIWTTYGDSITECSGNKYGWQDYVDLTIGFSKHNFRGHGGSEITYFQTSDPSAMTWTWTNPDNPTDVRTVARAGCMFSRIKTIPQNSDLVFVMFGTNDIARSPITIGTDCDFDANETTDTDWQTYAAANGLPTGDFKITTFKGAICSTIMKIQRWCPNAVIVFGTLFSGKGLENNTDICTEMWENSRGERPIDFAKATKEACEYMSVPCIDVFGTSGVNQLNRDLWLKDQVHPGFYSGRRMVARAVIGGLSQVMPLNW